MRLPDKGTLYALSGLACILAVALMMNFLESDSELFWIPALSIAGVVFGILAYRRRSQSQTGKLLGTATVAVSVGLVVFCVVLFVTFAFAIVTMM